MGWAAGFQAGVNMGQGSIDSYNQAQAWQAGKEMSKLGPQAGVTQGQGLQITAPDGTTSTAVIDPSAGGNLNDIMKQYTDAGYKVAPVTAPQFISRAGSLDTGVATGSQSAAMHDAGGFNVDHLNQMAQIYAQYGEPDKAAALTEQANQLQRQNVLDDRQNHQWDQQQGLEDAIKAANGDPVKIKAAYDQYDPSKGAAYQLANAQGTVAANNAKQSNDVQAILDQTHDWLKRSEDKTQLLPVAKEMVGVYNTDAIHQDGHTASLTMGSDNTPIMTVQDPSGKVVRTEVVTPALIRDLALQHQRYAISLASPADDRAQQQLDNQASQTKALNEHYLRSDNNADMQTRGLLAHYRNMDAAEASKAAAEGNYYGSANIKTDAQNNAFTVGMDRRTGQPVINYLHDANGNPVKMATGGLTVGDKLKVDAAITSDPAYIAAYKKDHSPGGLAEKVYAAKFQALTGTPYQSGQGTGLQGYDQAAAAVQRSTAAKGGARPATPATAAAPTRGLIPWMQRNGIHPLDAAGAVLPGSSQGAEDSEDNRF